MTPHFGPTTLLGMPELTGPEQLAKQIEHFKEIKMAMHQSIERKGKLPDVSWEEVAKDTPQYIEMELMLRMWILDLVALAGDDGISNPKLQEILNERTDGEFSQTFHIIPYQLANQKLIRGWKETAQDKIGRDAEIRFWGRKRD